MATQDEYIKTALRLPRDLHRSIQESAEEAGRSMNAEIIARLQASVSLSQIDAPIYEIKQATAAKKVLHAEEWSAICERIEKLGGIDSVLDSKRYKLRAELLSKDPGLAIDAPSSVYSSVVRSTKLSLLLTDEEIGKIAERIIEHRTAIGDWPKTEKE